VVLCAEYNGLSTTGRFRVVNQENKAGEMVGQVKDIGANGGKECHPASGGAEIEGCRRCSAMLWWWWNSPRCRDRNSTLARWTFDRFQPQQASASAAKPARLSQIGALLSFLSLTLSLISFSFYLHLSFSLYDLSISLPLSITSFSLFLSLHFTHSHPDPNSTACDYLIFYSSLSLILRRACAGSIFH
jgi:hypothetical protein